MIHKSLVFLFCAFASAFAAFPEEDNVLVLTDANFDEAIKAHDHILVEFYAPWCGHCKKLAPEWASAAGTLLSSGSSVRLAKVDATESKSLGERFEIKGFPTIKMFKAGTPSDYQGGRSAADIVAYARKQSGPPAKTISTAGELDALQASGEVFVVGYFADVTSAEAKAFISQATADDERQYVISSSAEVKSKLGAAGDHVALFKPYDEGRADHAVAAGVSREDLSKFVTGNALPLVNEFNAENSKKIFSSPIKKHALFFTPTGEAHHAPTMAVFAEAAKAHKGDVLVVHVSSAESKVLDYFGIKKESLPALVCADLSGESQMKKYFYSGAYEVEAVSTFIKQFLDGEIKPVLKSEEVTAEDTASPVKVVKGKSFNDIVINNDRDVLVEFYAPWCGHCKKLAPTWDALGEKFADSTTVTIAKTDATANEFDYPGLTIRGFPTIYFFKGNDKANPVRYEEGRELEDFVAFLKNNGAHPVTVAVEGSDEL